MSKAPAALQRYAARAEPLLAAFLDQKAGDWDKLPVDLKRAHALLREYVLRGGKRLRGALVVLGCEAAGGAESEALSPSIGCELLHAYLLIHDDFMDRDELRRGGPTLHRSLAGSHGEHVGASLALLLGSVCQAWAHQLLMSSAAPAERLVAALRLFEAAIEEVTVGQMLDLAAAGSETLTASAVLEIERRKTGGYTFDLPLRLGALLGGGSAALDAALAGYARPLGAAFQIADDLLGTFGAPEVTGKPNGSDLREGKRTLLIAAALEKATPADAAALRSGLGRADLTDAGADELRDILRRTGAVEVARQKAASLCAEALRALQVEAVPRATAATLTEIAEYAVSRAL